MIVVNLPQFPYRGVSAPYLWMFYKFLSSTKGDKHFFVHQTYLMMPEEWNDQNRWELSESSQRNFGYEIPTPEQLAEVSCSLMPDQLFERILAESGGNPLKAFETTLTEVVVDMSLYYANELDLLSNKQRVEVIFSPINCPSLQKVASERGIPLIYFELGPLRGPDYVDLAYFDFQGLNEKSEFSDRYLRYKTDVRNSASENLEHVRKQYLRGDLWLTNPVAKVPKFDLGVSLQIEDDTNLIASSNGFTNQSLIAYSKVKFPHKKIFYKTHPGSLFDIKPENGGGVYGSGTEFIFDCESILTINSSMGFEALIWKKNAYALGLAAYVPVIEIEDPVVREQALCFYLQNYLVPYELVFDEKYIKFRLSKPSEIEIRMAHQNEIFRIHENDIFELNQSIKLRDGQIASLSQVVAESDGQIASLSQVVAESDGQIASLSQAVAESDGQIASLSQIVAESDRQIASLRQAMIERDGQIASLTDETVRRGEWALREEAELKEAQAKFFAVTSSNSWRLTLPLREARRWLSSPILQAKRYTAATLRLTKSMYQALPFSYQTKARHRQLIARSFPRLLLATGTPAATIPVLAVRHVLPEHDSIVESTEASNEVANRATGIVISASDRPEVSVIIPIYGEINYTLRCLDSIASNPPQTAFEVIVVDDCSPDDSFDVLSSRVQGIRLLRNQHNLGFIRSCNNGAKAAGGGYLYFLNNDTEVASGWLDELLLTFREFPGTGIAGSKLVYPDWRLQEAGGIIWQDGSAWNFGRFQDSRLPVYNYAREVDYCSGASIMVPKVLFDELDGFDEHYLPAYGEDSDLALKIRDKGYRVIYQPLSTVIHYEGITSGTDTTQGTKACQVENSKKLFARWQQRLKMHQAPGQRVDQAKDRCASRRVLVLDHCTPTPNQDAGSVTVFNLLLLLREMGFQVTFIPEDNFLYMPEYTTKLQRAGIEVLYAPYVTGVEQHLKEFGMRYDLAFLFRPGVVERHLNVIRRRCPNAKVLYHTVDLHFLRMSREAELLSDRVKQKASEEMRERELAAIRGADGSIVHSTTELDILRPLVPASRLHVFPLIMDVKILGKIYAERKDIVFVGGYQHTPNVDAVKYFAESVMPLLRGKLPGVRFYAVGSKPPDEIKRLATEDIIVTGFVDDLTSLLNKMRVSVAPLRYGAGIKGKIGSAMAVGLPVVATSVAAEGMSLTDGENILIADGAEALADTLARIYRDEDQWNRISENGLSFAEQNWGATAAWGILARILADMGIQVKRGAYPLSLYQ